MARHAGRIMPGMLGGLVHLRFRGAAAAGLAAVALAAGSGAVWAAVIWGGPPRATVDWWGRLVDPHGRLTELGYFVTGSALTPDGRFLWTIGAGRVANDIEIVRTADGKVVQTLDDPRQALQGGVAISRDGRRAYVSDTHDSVGVRTYLIDRRSGRARATGTIPLPAPSGTAPPDDFPPRPPGSGGQSYAAGMALTADGGTLVVSENLDDRAAVIDLATRQVTQVDLAPGSAPGEHALPEGVAILGHRAFIADEGDGTVSSFDIDDPGAGVQRVTPVPDQADPVPIDLAKTHPYQIIVTADGRHLLLSETNADRVLELDPGDLGAPARAIYVRRAEGIGTNPLGLAVSADGNTLFVADGGENAVRAIALTAQAVATPRGRLVLPAGAELARIPSGIYPDRVEVDPHTDRLMVVSAYGVGPGSTANSDQAGPGVGDLQQSSIRVLSTLQTFDLSPSSAARDRQLFALGRGGARAAVPLAGAGAATGAPLAGPDGGPSRQIKYVFYVVAENKTYDIELGDLTRDPRHPLQPGRVPVGDGDPCLVVYGETRSLPHRGDGSPCPVSRFASKDPSIRVNPGQLMDGQPITPNQHKIARQFVDLDNLYADTTTSDDGHLFTSSGYQSDYELRGTEANNGPSPRPFDLIYPQAAPPQGFIFDQFARAGVSFFNYGEAVSGTLIPDAQLSPQERAIRAEVQADSDYAGYPSSAAIDTNPVSVGVNPNFNVDDPQSLAAVGAERVDDSVQPDEVKDAVLQEVGGATVPVRQSRLLAFEQRFNPEVDGPGCQANPGDPAVCRVPQFNELIMANNHTGGTTPGHRTPDALVRDNDLAIGQLADLISHSPIWPYSAIFVIQDDSQDGSDHVSTRRIASFLISPWAKHQAVVSTHYDQAGVIHTMDMILGVAPEYLQDALATPLSDAFTTKPDLTPYDAVPFTQAALDEVNTARSPMAAASARQRWEADAVNPNLVNRITYAYRYGTARACPVDVGRDHSNPCSVTGSTRARPGLLALGAWHTSREVPRGSGAGR